MDVSVVTMDVLDVMKLVMGLHHGSPMVVKLDLGLHQGCYIREHKVSRGGEASDGASSPKMQEVKFVMELHHGSPKECEASVEASPYELPYPCERVSGRLHK